jgi:hypothetical protein
MECVKDSEFYTLSTGKAKAFAAYGISDPTKVTEIMEWQN